MSTLLAIAPALDAGKSCIAAGVLLLTLPVVAAVDPPATDASLAPRVTAQATASARDTDTARSTPRRADAPAAQATQHPPRETAPAVDWSFAPRHAAPARRR
jgi:hypothetical protein